MTENTETREFDTLWEKRKELLTEVQSIENELKSRLSGKGVPKGGVEPQMEATAELYPTPRDVDFGFSPNRIDQAKKLVESGVEFNDRESMFIAALEHGHMRLAAFIGEGDEQRYKTYYEHNPPWEWK